jgi:hypothetical protein
MGVAHEGEARRRGGLGRANERELGASDGIVTWIRELGVLCYGPESAGLA